MNCNGIVLFTAAISLSSVLAKTKLVGKFPIVFVFITWVNYFDSCAGS
jgi:hypothetical protein